MHYDTFQDQAFLDINISMYEALEIAGRLVISNRTAALSNVTLDTASVGYRRTARLRDRRRGIALILRGLRRRGTMGLWAR